MASRRVRPALAAAEGSRRLITLDTSGLLALIDSRERHHDSVLEAFDADPGPHVVPAALLGEIGHFLEPRAATAFLLDLAEENYELDCGEHDLVRAAALAQRYESLPLGLVDAAVIACAERRGGRVLTLDRRHFDVIAREVALEILP
ncbi:MAG: type II toxin-antitoxin system VapC family toxin [Gaiellaceae bacterium]